MADLNEIAGHLKDTGIVPAKPSYDDWLTQLATAYGKQFASQGEFGYTDSENTTPNEFGPNALPAMVQRLRENKTITNMYKQGLSADQIVSAPLANSHSFDAGGFGVFDGKSYGELSAQQKGLVDKGYFDYTYNPTMQGVNGNEGGGYYWQATDKAPKVLGKYGTGAFTPYNPFRQGDFNDNGKVVYDPNYGLVTLSNNRHANPMDEVIYQAGPMAAMMIMTMGAGAALTAGGSAGAAAGAGGFTEAQLGSMMLKVPGLAQSISGGANPIGAILSLAAGATGVPGAGMAANLLTQSLAGDKKPASSSGGNQTTQQPNSANPFALLMAIAEAKRQGGGGHG